MSYYENAWNASSARNYSEAYWQPRVYPNMPGGGMKPGLGGVGGAGQLMNGWNTRPEDLQYIPEHWLQFPAPNPALHYLLGLIYIMFTFFALTGNGIVIWIFSTAKPLKTPSNMFVVNLAICDFLMMTKTPIFIYNSFNTGFELGIQGCEAFAFMGTLSGIGAGVTNAAIAFDRYSTIARPIDGRLSRGQALGLIALIWMFTLTWTLIPQMGVWGRWAPEGFLTACTIDYLTDSDEVRHFLITMFITVYVIPMMMIFHFYSRIVGFVVNHEKALREQAKKMNVESLRSNQGQQQQTAEVRIAKAAITVCFLYVCAWTPYGVMSLIGAFGDKQLLTPAVNMIPACCCKLVACIDPYVYAISHPKFRIELAKRLPWLEIQEKAPPPDTQSTTTEATG